MAGPSAPRPVAVPYRYATDEEWATTALVLRPGEAGVAVGSGLIKYGDGVHRWPELPVHYAPADTGTSAPPAPSSGVSLTLLAEAAMQ
jgi:hypothetical protein